MGWRFRKHITLGRGLRVNLSKSGVSLGLGAPGANINLSRRGTRTTFGLPGTGLYHQTSRSWQPPASSGSVPAGAAPPRSKLRTILLVIAIAAAVFGILWLMNAP